MLDVDPSYGQGIYDAELLEPEHSNAGSTSLWELSALHVRNLFNTIYIFRYLFLTIQLFFRGIIIQKYVNCLKL